MTRRRVTVHRRKSNGAKSVHARKGGSPLPKMRDPWKQKAVARRSGPAR